MAPAVVPLAVVEVHEPKAFGFEPQGSNRIGPLTHRGGNLCFHSRARRVGFGHAFQIGRKTLDTADRVRGDGFDLGEQAARFIQREDAARRLLRFHSGIILGTRAAPGLPSNCVRTIVLLLLLGVATGADAQSLPSEPITLGGGRVVVGGEFTATIAPEDPGFFNYTDYEYSAIRNLRLGVTAEVRAHPRLQFLGEIRLDRGDAFEAYGMYARIRPWLSRRIDIQIGRIPPTFGAFGRGAYGSSNMLIGYPLAYQYLTSLRTDALPATTAELLRMRGRGWLVTYGLGNTTPAPGLPLVNAIHWDTGVQVHGVSGVVEWTGALTTGSLSNPRVRDDNGGRQLAGRAVVHATPGLALGISAARGAFMNRALQPFLTEGAQVDDAIQRAIGVDAEYSAGRFIGRGEVLWSQWMLPTSLAGGPLRASSVLAEARYRLIPGVHVAARVERLGFSDVRSGDVREVWDAPVKRFEVGAGWSIQRNVMLKASWQRNLRDAGRIRHDSFGIAQIAYWF
jgi:hypothetical protein